MSKKDTAMEKKEQAPMTKHGDIFADYDQEDLQDMMDATGTEDKPEEDRRPPLYSWNLDIVDESGQKVEKNKFYDGQSGDQFEQVNCALIGLKETRVYSVRDESTGQKDTICQSYDRKTGVLRESGDLMNCADCPHQQAAAGKRKNCTLVMRFMAWDLERQQFFIINFKRTSYIPMSNHLQRNFFGQYKNPKTGKRGDIPLYMLGTKITLKMESGPSMTWYEPVLESTGPLPKEVVLDLLPSAQNFKKMSMRELVQEENKEEVSADEDVPF